MNERINTLVLSIPSVAWIILSVCNNTEVWYYPAGLFAVVVISLGALVYYHYDDSKSYKTKITELENKITELKEKNQKYSDLNIQKEMENIRSINRINEIKAEEDAKANAQIKINNAKK